MTESTYQTKDLPEATFISCHMGLPVLERSGGPIFFHWSDHQKARDLSAKYWAGGKVTALKYAQVMRTLKDLIFSKTR